MNRAVIGIGSNIRPEDNIDEAILRMSRAHRILKKSRFVATPPIGSREQPDFVNGAILIETSMERDALKTWLRNVEAGLGRVRSEDKNAPRTIDLDIVVWSGEIVDEDVYARDFLRRAVQEVCPGLKLEGGARCGKNS
ncbi:MAG TPA: 2-amino-4-hydroxy-6-hydroxymethyldihydropteridine diphosphokinase [Candidatus Binatia bacterium]